MKKYMDAAIAWVEANLIMVIVITAGVLVLLIAFAR